MVNNFVFSTLYTLCSWGWFTLFSRLILSSYDMILRIIFLCSIKCIYKEMFVRFIFFKSIYIFHIYGIINNPLTIIIKILKPVYKQANILLEEGSIRNVSGFKSFCIICPHVEKLSFGKINSYEKDTCKMLSVLYKYNDKFHHIWCADIGWDDFNKIIIYTNYDF